MRRAMSRCTASTATARSAIRSRSRASPTPASTRTRSAPTPGNRTAILIARGNNAAAGKPEDPGALKVYGFKDGALTNLASIAPGTGSASGRGISISTSEPWVFVSIERQNKLYVYRLAADGALGRDPSFVQGARRSRQRQAGAGRQPDTSIPTAVFVYLTNRNQGEVEFEGKKVFNGGEQRRGVRHRPGERRAEVDPDHRRPGRTCAPSASIRAAGCWSRRASARCPCGKAIRSRRSPPASWFIASATTAGSPSRKYDVDTGGASSSGAGWWRWRSAGTTRMVAAAGLEPALRFPRSRF